MEVKNLGDFQNLQGFEKIIASFEFGSWTKGLLAMFHWHELRRRHPPAGGQTRASKAIPFTLTGFGTLSGLLLALNSKQP
jgi:hypothetical protein